MPGDVRLRKAETRWAELSRMATALARLVETNGRLDAHVAPHRKVCRVEDCCRSIDKLAARVAQEEDRLTAERLAAELQARKARHALVGVA